MFCRYCPHPSYTPDRGAGLTACEFCVGALLVTRDRRASGNFQRYKSKGSVSEQSLNQDGSRPRVTAAVYDETTGL